MPVLSPDKDPFGHAVSDYFSHKKASKINVFSNIADIEYINPSYLFRAVNAMPVLETIALDSCYGTILDIGACAGSHSLILQNRGFDVTTLEYSGLCCEVMKKRGLNKIVHADIYEFDSSRYDTLLLLMNGIGIAGTLRGYEKFLDHSKKILSKNGRILFDSSDIDYIYRDEEGGRWINLNAEYYGEVNYRIKYKNISSDNFNWLYIDFETAKRIANEKGYEIKLLAKGGHFDYLAKLTLITE